MRTPLHGNRDHGELACVSLWDSGTGKLMYHVPDSVQATHAVFAPDSKTLACGLKSQKLHEIMIWDLVKRKEVIRFKTGIEGRATLGFCKDGKMLLTAEPGDEEATIRRWNAITGKEERLHLRVPDQRETITMSPDGTKVASWAEEVSLQVKDVATDQLIGPADASDWIASALIFSADGNELTTLAGGRHVLFWDVAYWQHHTSVGYS
jgi:WD40 repeat protein